MRNYDKGARGMRTGLKIGGILVALAMLAVVAQAGERDPLRPRVPAGKLAEVKAIVNPVPATPESIERGREVYRGIGSCNVCHGEDGNGKGIGASGLDPSPRDLTSKKWHKARTDGELMWVLRHGSPGTAMITVVPGLISEEEGWDVINFVRSLRK